MQHSRKNHDYLTTQDLARQKVLAIQAKKSRSPNPPKKYDQENENQHRMAKHQRVFSQDNIQIPRNYHSKQERSTSNKKRHERLPNKFKSPIPMGGDKQGSYLTPDRWALSGWKYVNHKDSPMKKFLNHPNKVNFTGNVCNHRPNVSHSNFQLKHPRDTKHQDKEHFQTSYKNQFEDRFTESPQYQPHIIKTIDFDQEIRSRAPLSPLAQKGKIMFGKNGQHKKNHSLHLHNNIPTKVFAKNDYVPEIKYGNSRMNVLNHTISNQFDMKNLAQSKSPKKKGGIPRQSMESTVSGVSVWAGIPVAGDYSKVFNRQKTFQSEWQSASFHGGVFKEPLSYHAHP